MADSAKTNNININGILSNDKINQKLLLELQSSGRISEAEIKFLSLSKEKADSSKTIIDITNKNITLDNYEEVFSLQNYYPMGGTVNPEQSVRNIRYRDKKGTIVAIIQIDTVNKKIRLQNFGDILPRQESFSPSQVAVKLQNMARFNNWITEDGGVNQFNGNIEFRYKNFKGEVMAAVIKKPNGVYDMVAEYSYKNGKKSQMILTNQYGQSRVVYDGSEKCIQETRIDTDTDGMIVEITKLYN